MRNGTADGLAVRYARDIVPAVVASTARLGPILAMQTPEQRESAEIAIAEGARKYVTAQGVEIPMAVLLAVGHKLTDTALDLASGQVGVP